MFKCSSRYRHISCLDIDLYVVTTLVEKNDSVRLLVKYYNRHYNVFQPDIYTTEAIWIKHKDYSNWSELK